MGKKLKYVLFFKPFGVLCQFTDRSGRKTIADFDQLPEGVYPAGRLDADSEGLVLLTNDGELIHYLLEPKYQHPRTYLVQVEKVPSEESLERLREGVVIEGEKTLPAGVKLLHVEPRLPPRSAPIRFRKNIPTAWIELTLREGRNRQVRKMTAAVGHPTLRLVRVGIGPLFLGRMRPGESRVLTEEEIKSLLRSVASAKA